MSQINGKTRTATRRPIADASGIVVTAYRAPSFSITELSTWALEILAEHDIRIDSSVFASIFKKRDGALKACATKMLHINRAVGIHAGSLRTPDA